MPVSGEPEGHTSEIESGEAGQKIHVLRCELICIELFSKERVQEAIASCKTNLAAELKVDGTHVIGEDERNIRYSWQASELESYVNTTLKSFVTLDSKLLSEIILTAIDSPDLPFFLICLRVRFNQTELSKMPCKEFNLEMYRNGFRNLMTSLKGMASEGKSDRPIQPTITLLHVAKKNEEISKILDEYSEGCGQDAYSSLDADIHVAFGSPRESAGSQKTVLRVNSKDQLAFIIGNTCLPIGGSDKNSLSILIESDDRPLNYQLLLDYVSVKIPRLEGPLERWEEVLLLPLAIQTWSEFTCTEIGRIRKMLSWLSRKTIRDGSLDKKDLNELGRLGFRSSEILMDVRALRDGPLMSYGWLSEGIGDGFYELPYHSCQPSPTNGSAERGILTHLADCISDGVLKVEASGRLLDEAAKGIDEHLNRLNMEASSRRMESLTYLVILLAILPILLGLGEVLFDQSGRIIYDSICLATIIVIMAYFFRNLWSKKTIIVLSTFAVSGMALAISWNYGFGPQGQNGSSDGLMMVTVATTLGIMMAMVVSYNLLRCEEDTTAIKSWRTNDVSSEKGTEIGDDGEELKVM